MHINTLVHSIQIGANTLTHSLTQLKPHKMLHFLRIIEVFLFSHKFHSIVINIIKREKIASQPNSRTAAVSCVVVCVCVYVLHKNVMKRMKIVSFFCHCAISYCMHTAAVVILHRRNLFTVYINLLNVFSVQRAIYNIALCIVVQRSKYTHSLSCASLCRYTVHLSLSLSLVSYKSYFL